MHPAVTQPADARSAPADPAADDRGRDRRLVAGIATTVGSRAVGAVVPLLLLPLTHRYLGTELFSLWQAVTALTAMAAFADLGLGNGLMTKLADTQARGETAQARRYVSTAYLTLAGAAVAACAALWIGALAIPWTSVFNLPSAELVPTARSMTLVCLTVFILNVPMSLVIRVQYGVQQVARRQHVAVGRVPALPPADPGRRGPRRRAGDLGGRRGDRSAAGQRGEQPVVLHPADAGAGPVVAVRGERPPPGSCSGWAGCSCCSRQR